MENLTLALGRGSGLALFPHLQKMNKQTKKCYVSNAFQAIQGIFPFLKNMFKIKMVINFVYKHPNFNKEKTLKF